MAKGRRRSARRSAGRRDKQFRPVPRDLNLDGFAQVESGPGGVDHYVRRIPAARANKVYRCPGCDHPIAAGTAHLVAWPEEDFGGAGVRRHWHTGCWGGRHTRGVTRRWS